MPFPITLITSNGALACKSYALDDAGKLSKMAAAQIYSGRAHIETFASLREFVDSRALADTQTAYVYGVPANGERSQRIRTKAAEGPGISRSKADFTWPDGSGILFLDVDEAGHTVAELDLIMTTAFSPWAACERVWIASSTAFIRKEGGETLVGDGGWRAYCVIDNAAKIPDVTRYIHYRLWQMGHGAIKVSKSGARLDRSLIDTSVASPERLDFVATPILEDGLERFAPEPQFIGPAGATLSTGLLPNVPTYKEWRKADPAFTAAWNGSEKEAKTASDAEASRRGLPADDLWRIHETHILPRTWPVTLDDGSQTTVGQLLDFGRPDMDRARCLDPLEPDYDGGRVVGQIYLDDGVPGIWSYARGGRKFRFSERLGAITHRAGYLHETVRETLEIMRRDDRLFQDRSGKLMLVPTSGGMQKMTWQRLKTHLEGLIEWTYFDKQGNPFVGGCKDEIAKSVMSEIGSWRLPELAGVITAPTLRLDGTVLRCLGYDAETRLFLAGSGFSPWKGQAATQEENLKLALAKIMEPARLFPFASETDKAVYVAAILCGVMRKTLKTAPGFVVSAPQPSAGKTKLCQVVQEVTCGKQTIITVKAREEFQKALDAAMLAGMPCVLFDNVTSSSSARISDSLDGLLTSTTYSFRIMGGLGMAEVSASTLFLISSNNYKPSSDLYRRLLVCRLDAKTERAERREFPFIPEVVARQERQNIVAAALFILQAYHAAGKPRTFDGQMASYETFDVWICQCVGWLGMPDIVTTQEALKGEDEGAQQSARVFAAIRDRFEDASFDASGAENPHVRNDSRRRHAGRRSKARGVALQPKGCNPRRARSPQRRRAFQDAARNVEG